MYLVYIVIGALWIVSFALIIAGFIQLSEIRNLKKLFEKTLEEIRSEESYELADERNSYKSNIQYCQETKDNSYQKRD